MDRWLAIFSENKEALLTYYWAVAASRHPAGECRREGNPLGQCGSLYRPSKALHMPFLEDTKSYFHLLRLPSDPRSEGIIGELSPSSTTHLCGGMVDRDPYPEDSHVGQEPGQEPASVRRSSRSMKPRQQTSLHKGQGIRPKSFKLKMPHRRGRTLILDRGIPTGWCDETGVALCMGGGWYHHTRVECVDLCEEAYLRLPQDQIDNFVEVRFVEDLGEDLPLYRPEVTMRKAKGRKDVSTRAVNKALDYMLKNSKHVKAQICKDYQLDITPQRLGQLFDIYS